jgi:hypothetical protein
MRNIPLLVNTCDNLKQAALNFDQVDDQKYFNNTTAVKHHETISKSNHFNKPT